MSINIEGIKGTIRHIVEDENHELQPVLFMLDPMGKTVILPLSSIDKEYWPAAIRQVAAKLDASEYAMVFESWMARLPIQSAKRELLDAGEIRVSELPLDDRIEAAVLLHVWRSGKSEASMAKILPAGRDKRRLLPWEYHGHMESHFIVSW